ncbi:plasmid segregation protein ParM domain-containing protein [Acidithiobacillus sp. M4-SHS-6]|uniref:ParM/StbA family protein n=1 Tax=Acidithiobacillus sp. M4-SHS-6 TaxID=3383024 RepID=UPI0039BE70BE
MIAIDDGYGDLKLGNGRRFRVFPSKAVSGRVVRSRYVNGDFELGGSPVLESEGAIFTIQDGINAEDTRFDDWPNSTLNRILCRYAAAEMGMQDGDNLVTGLPMSVYFDRDGRKNQKAVQRRTESLKKPVVQHMPDGMQRHLATPGRIKIIPQGLAAIFDHLIGDDGQIATLNTVGVVDIGARTTDVAVYLLQDDGENTIDASRSGGFRRGVSDLVDALAQELQKSLRLPALPPLSMAAASLRTGRFKASGQEYNVDSQRLHVLRTGLPGILQEAEQILSAGDGAAGLMDLDRILLVGGGAYLAESIGLSLWEQTCIPQNPELANVRGMVKLGQVIEHD